MAVTSGAGRAGVLAGRSSLVGTSKASDLSQTLIRQLFCHQCRRSGVPERRVPIPWGHGGIGWGADWGRRRCLRAAEIRATGLAGMGHDPRS